jgi:hypothetical protein
MFVCAGAVPWHGISVPDAGRIEIVAKEEAAVRVTKVLPVSNNWAVNVIARLICLFNG